MLQVIVTVNGEQVVIEDVSATDPDLLLVIEQATEGSVTLNLEGSSASDWHQRWVD